jgi:hypothetical protein
LAIETVPFDPIGVCYGFVTRIVALLDEQRNEGAVFVKYRARFVA